MRTGHKKRWGAWVLLVFHCCSAEGGGSSVCTTWNSGALGWNDTQPSWVGQKPCRCEMGEIIAPAKLRVALPIISVVAAFPQALAQHDLFTFMTQKDARVLVAVVIIQFGAQELTASRHMTAHWAAKDLCSSICRKMKSCLWDLTKTPLSGWLQMSLSSITAS